MSERTGQCRARAFLLRLDVCFGVESSSTIAAQENLDMHLGPAIPILRIFDEQKAREFYVNFLGFSVDWEHRFEPGLPLYLQVSRADCKLHLSEHHGDATPGSALRIPTRTLDTLHAEVTAKTYKYARPGVVIQPWGRDMTVTDPFGNRLVFFDVAEH